jgi:hypothetical protein
MRLKRAKWTTEEVEEPRGFVERQVMELLEHYDKDATVIIRSANGDELIFRLVPEEV